MAKILVVGLNPAWQTVMAFSAFGPGQVNRAMESVSFASGKGINAAKVLRRLGHDVHVLQILGGENGRRCLGGCLELGLHSLDVWVDVETRQCLTIRDLGNGQVTEVIQNFSIGPTSGVAAELLYRVEASQAYAAVVVCGSVPAGVANSILPALLRKVAAPIVVVDAWQGFSKEDLGLATCFKVNREEMAGLCGRMGWRPAEYAAGCVTEWTTPSGVSGAGPESPPFLVTSGPDIAWMLRQGWPPARFQPPVIEKVANSTGAGDTVSAGLADGLVKGLELDAAFRRSLAMGSASCLLPGIAEFREEDFQSLLAQDPSA